MLSIADSEAWIPSGDEPAVDAAARWLALDLKGPLRASILDHVTEGGLGRGQHDIRLVPADRD
ncbi:MAG TPA: hypothetical protein VFF12_11915, partial [Myxococcaceae bacterium]|nr:hypothetical protein [Myxococcaceae bacterium]